MLDLIVNPKAHNGKTAKVAEKIEEILKSKGVEYKFHYTTKPKEAISVAKELSKTATDIIAIGGDGTINEVFNGIDPEKNNFGIIPCGSGNDFVASAKIPLDVEKAVAIILNETPKETDYMVCGGVRGLNIIGTGIDVDILNRCRSSKFWRGKLQYVFSLIISLIKFKFYKFNIQRENGKEEKEALIACVGNGKRFGGGIRMCPDAEIDDGKLDFVIAGKLKKIRIPFAFVKLMKGKILGQDFISCEKVEHVKIEFDKPVTIQIDGELYDDIDFDLSIVKHGVKIYRP